MAPFNSIITGVKRFEWRKFDRDFKVGDVLHLREWDETEERYTGRDVCVKCLYIVSEGFGIPEGFCIISISTPLLKVDELDHNLICYGCSEMEDSPMHLSSGWKYCPCCGRNLFEGPNAYDDDGNPIRMFMTAGEDPGVYRTLEQQIAELWESRGLEVGEIRVTPLDDGRMQWSITAKEQKR